ncbi:dihydroorotase [Candidatus Endowatersipora endosymbiont of Watersipora subatra]|uniref:dihydroorotase n=1 Tax=Candidatus Endowatersipora endosymbiont of Watersipora subatra TaxID=3077946 RepID=UPI00312CB82A
MSLFINARVMDPLSGLDQHADVLVANETVARIGKSLPLHELRSDSKIIDCKGHVLSPGIVDMRVFIGEPGAEHHETMKSASNAAAAGGVTTLIMMPDTNPVIDDMSLVEFVRQTARSRSLVRVFPTAALSQGLLGVKMTEFGLLSDAGAIAFTDGRSSTLDSQMMSRALTYAKDFGKLIISTNHDLSLGSGVMNAGLNATRLGLSGIPRESEIIPLERDMRLVAMTEGKYHAATLSTSSSVEVIANAKKKNLDVTAGVAIANLCLNELDIGSYRTFFKVLPPLRSEDDRQSMISGIKEGIIDVICSNHDPQDVETKRHPFAEAADGVIGLETLLSASLRLYHTDNVPLMRLLTCLTSAPAERLGLKTGRIQVGAPADMMLFDPDYPWILRKELLHSRSKNTAFEGARFQGKVLKTIVSGKIVFSMDE